jgi:alpha-N-acetylglucosamine transferase
MVPVDMKNAFMKVRQQMSNHEDTLKNISNAVIEGIIIPYQTSFTKLKVKNKRDL